MDEIARLRAELRNGANPDNEPSIRLARHVGYQFEQRIPSTVAPGRPKTPNKLPGTTA